MPVHLSPQLKLFMSTASEQDRCLLIASVKRHAVGGHLASELRAAGYVVRYSSGELLTLECGRDELKQLIRWPGLRSLELSSPLLPEQR